MESEQIKELQKTLRIYELTKAILLVDDFDELLRIITVETTLLFNARGSIIRIVENNKLGVKASIGISNNVIESTSTIDFVDGLSEMAVMQDKTIIYNKTDDISTITDFNNALCTPLKTGSVSLGTFTVIDKLDEQGNAIPFDENDVKLFEGFTTIAAIVIKKLCLYEKALLKEKEANKEKLKAQELNIYLQSLINNTADAIITMDTDRVIKSWNYGAENTYGYSRDEAIGKSYLLMPDFLFDIERLYTERVKKGETIKNVETVHKTKNGSIIDVSITMAPIKDLYEKIIGISYISRDITIKKKTERELMKKNDMLNRLIFIGSAMRSTLDLERLIRMILTAVTTGDGFGFNRAMLFLLDEDKNILKGVMGVGPSGHEEAWRIWSTLSMENKNLNNLIEEIEKGPLRKDSFMDKLCCSIELPLSDNTVLALSVKNKKAYNVQDAHLHEYANFPLVQHLGSTSYAVIPLISQEKVIGVLWVDNLFSRRQITDNDIEYLSGFTSQIASAIENARLFERVYQAEKELENIFESISDMLYVTDTDYIIKSVNQAVVNKIGKPKKEIIGKKSFEIFSDTFVSCETRFKNFLKKSGEPLIEEVEDTFTDNTYLLSCSPILDSSGNILGNVHIVRDITELKKLKERADANERMAALGEIAAKVAHEIRNPLLSIGGFARRLERRLADEEKDYARIIVDEVQRLENILSDTLSFVKTTRLKFSKVNLNEMFDSIITLLEPVLQERQNEIVEEIPHDFIISINEERFREALINIITNANQFTTSGTIKIFAERRSIQIFDSLGDFKIRQEAVISISDTGCGIRREDIPRIFDPFFTTRTNGTGLGLAITKRVIEENGGRIEVQSTLGEGTTFKIYLNNEEE
ncbi:MAG TPA: PAS domain S-box protein [Nitrospirae bacterium]|nr:PAS domain S-box protein [Nitrospirota bacterium]